VNTFRRHAGRLRDELPLEYPEALVVLVDALREYLRSHDAIERDLLQDGSITLEDVARLKPHIDRCREVLRELERSEIDPSLWGMRRRK
jgi:hypothetical protein